MLILNCESLSDILLQLCIAYRIYPDELLVLNEK